MAQTVELRGRRIKIRDWRHEDLPVFNHWMQPGRHWQQFDGPYYAHPTAKEVERMQQKLQSAIANKKWPDPRRRLVIAGKQSDKMWGMVSWYWISEETNWPAVGIGIYDPAIWGQGIGWEALGLWSDYLFTALPEIVRLDLRTWSGNRGMMRLAEKLGYRLEACFRRARVVDGRLYDGLGYGILREEWEAKYPGGFAAHLKKGENNG